MENTYGIGVTNRYSLFLDEEEDPLELLKLQELERETKRKSQLLEKETKLKNTEPKAKSAPVRKATKETQNAKVALTTDPLKPKDVITKAKVNKKNAKFIGDSREDWNNSRNRDNRNRLYQTSGDISRDGPREGLGGRSPRSDMPSWAQGGPREGHGRGVLSDMMSGLRLGTTRGPRYDTAGDDRRGPTGTVARGRGYRGMPGNRGGYENRARRDFDGPVGTDKIDVPPATEAPSNEWAAEPIVAGEAMIATPAVTEAEAEAETPAAIEEEPRELTLDEYKALRSSREKPKYNLRKAGEGEDLTQWNTMFELSKKTEEEELDDEAATEYDVLEYPQRVGRQKHLLNIDIHFADTRRGGRGRGGRGAGGSRAPGSSPRPEEAVRPIRGRGEPGPAIRGEMRCFRGQKPKSLAPQSAPEVIVSQRGEMRCFRGQKPKSLAPQSAPEVFVPQRGEMRCFRGQKPKSLAPQSAPEVIVPQRGEMRCFRGQKPKSLAPQSAPEVIVPQRGEMRCFRGQKPKSFAPQSAPKVHDEHDFPSLG